MLPGAMFRTAHGVQSSRSWMLPMPFFEKDDFWGVASNRVRRTYNLFEPILDDILGEGVRADAPAGAICGCAIAGVAWRGPDGQEVSYSSR
jgi:hypothetical protein